MLGGLVVLGEDLSHAHFIFIITSYVAYTLQKCQWVRVGFDKSSIFLENPNTGAALSEESAQLRSQVCLLMYAIGINEWCNTLVMSRRLIFGSIVRPCISESA